MPRVHADRLDAWLTARVNGCALVLATLAGHRLELADADPADVADMARYLAHRLAAIACCAHDHDTALALRDAAEDLAAARADLAAVHTPAPERIPPAWTGELEQESTVMDARVSLTYRAPGPACTGCAGRLVGPPWYLTGIADPLCVTCVRALGHHRLADRVEAARAELAAVGDDHDRAESIARRLLNPE